MSHTGALVRTQRLYGKTCTHANNAPSIHLSHPTQHISFSPPAAKVCPLPLKLDLSLALA